MNSLPLLFLNNWSYNWAPSLGLSFSFRLDPFSLMFAFVILFVGALILIFSASYMRGQAHQKSFYCYFILFALSMLGLVLADNLLLMFVFWELTSLTSYLLISLKHEDEVARKNALQALLVTAGGGLVLLVGILGLGLVFETYSYSALLDAPEKLHLSRESTWILVCILIGCLTKSAQFPFHFWLPNAMVAPTPVSAMLHSATMVKAGVFLLYRMKPLFDFHPLWAPVLLVLGSVTFVYGALWAFAQMDLKKVMAGTTLSVLGALTLLLGLPGRVALLAFVILFLSHAFYKAALFLSVGALEKGIGTRLLPEISGLRYRMPLTSLGMALALLSLAGLPPALSFFAKEALLGAVRVSPYASYLTAAILVVSSLSMAFAFYLVRAMMFGHMSGKVQAGISCKPVLFIPIYVLSLSALVTPFVIAPFVELLFPGINFRLWHGVTPELILSLLSFAFAFLFLAIFESHLVPLFQATVLRLSFDKYYDKIIESFSQLAQSQKQAWQRSGLRFYLSLILWFAAVLLSWQMNKLIWPVETAPIDLHILDAFVSIAILAGLWGVVFFKRDFLRALAVSLVGLGISFFYFLYGAPDLALTQLLVEFFSTFLLLWLLLKLPKDQLPKLSRAIQTRNWFVATLFAFSMGAALWIAMRVDSHDELTQFFAQKSLLEAHGRNVVNVILVDFRGFDTLGEITVLAIAAMGLGMLLKKAGGQKS